MIVHLLSGPIGSGKTTRLMQWVEEKNAARGILSPVAGSRRFFLHHPSGETRSMEAKPGETEVYATPRYRFSRAAFEWAEKKLRIDLEEAPQWLVIDEIGKLELRGEGFASLLGDLAPHPVQTNLVIVVRDELVRDVVAHFALREARRLEL